MPSFPDPFAGNVDRKVSKAELIQALRIDIAGELEAIFLYESHALATDDPLVKKVLMDIRDEEKAHIGELTSLLRYLDPAETEHFLSGESEVKEMMEELGIKEPDLTGPAPASGPTVGSLVDED